MLDSTNIVSGLAGRVDLGLNYGLVGNSFICEDTYRYILFGILVRKEENKKFKKKKKKKLLSVYTIFILPYYVF
jgi:hypothetical protein